MTTPHNFAKNTGWGRADHKKCLCELFPSPLNTHLRTSKLHHHKKKLNPTEAYLSDLLHTVILMDIEIWVFGLENRDKFKANVSCINFMYNPVLFSIPTEIWTPKQNFRFFFWYNEVLYEWAHRHIPTLYSGLWLRYQYYRKLYTGITKLTPVIVQSHGLAVTFKQITRDKKSSIPYFKQKILNSDKENLTTHDELNLPGPRPRWTCCDIKSGIYYLFYLSSQNFFMC